MSVLSQLESKGLIEEFESLLASYVASDGDNDTVSEIRSTVDSVGLRSPKTTQVVGLMQRHGKLKVGLYKELLSLNARFENSEPSSDTEDNTQQGGNVVTENVQTQEAVQVDPAVAAAAGAPEDTVQVSTGLSETEEAKLKEKLAKEEEKYRKRLAMREAKMRERLLARAEKRANRKGMKLEESQKLQDLRVQMKAIRGEIKERRDAIKVLQAQVNEIRPRKAKKAKAE